MRNHHPRKRRSQDQSSSRPCHAKERKALVGVDPNIIPMAVDHTNHIINNRRRDRARNHARHEPNQAQQAIEQRRELPSAEKPDEGAEEGHARGGGRHAVEHEHDLGGQRDGFHAVLDRGRPVQRREVDAGLELGLDDGGGIEVEHARLVTAVRDVQTRCVCQIRHGSGGVVALAVVEDVRAVEVVDAEVFDEGGDGGLDVAFDGVEDVVDDGGFGVGGEGGGAEVAAEHGGVEGEHVR